MDDNRILDLYWARSEDAISETADKYGRYCRYIADNILRNEADTEECVNDTYLKAWNSIPPNRPNMLSVYLGKITRNLALDRYRLGKAEKRGFGQTALALEELQECVSKSESMDKMVDDLVLRETLDRFLSGLPDEKRKIFMRRYWYLSPVKEIAADFDMGESSVKMILLRLRKKLKEFFEKEDVYL